MLTDILAEIWRFTREVSVYLIGGFLLAGLIRAFFTERLVARYLGSGGFRPVVLASLFGVPLPLCSCSVLPTAGALRRGGASRAATSSFLISTPETGVDSIAVSYALLDPILTVARPVAALFTAFFTGALELVFNPEKNSEQPPPEDAPGNAKPDEPQPPLAARIGEGIRYSFFTLMADLAWYLFWGLILAGLVSYFLPAGLLADLPGGRLTAAAIVIAAGVPLYICATSSTPLAAALIAKGLSPGLALLLLLVGPATNTASLAVIYRLLGLRSLVIYLAGIISAAVAFFLALDWLYARLGIDARAVIGAGTELAPGWLETACALALTALIAWGIWKEKLRPRVRRMRSS